MHRACTLVLVTLALALPASAVAKMPHPRPDQKPPPHLSLWQCVHKQERTAWHDPGWPYLGGLQLGSWFVYHYMARVPHPPGLPHQWSPMQQMWFAELAYRHERFSHSWLWGQWPPSRGVCF